MGTTAYVRTYSGEVLDRGRHDLVPALRVAQQIGLPFLESVDEYDDTVFNRKQLAVVIKEFDILRQSGVDEAVIGEVTRLVELVRVRPHRYLVFNGD